MAKCRALSTPEIMMINEAFTGDFRSRDRAIFMLGIFTGFRISELLAIRLGWLLHFPSRLRHQITIPAKYCKGGEKSKTNPLPRQYSVWFGPWLERLQELGFSSKDQPAFVGYSGQPIDRLSYLRIFKRTANRAGVYPTRHGIIGTHCMRKTYSDGTLQIFGRKDPKTAISQVQKALHHESIASTMAYIPSLQDEINDGILEYCDDLFAGIDNKTGKPTQSGTRDQDTPSPNK